MDVALGADTFRTLEVFTDCLQMSLDAILKIRNLSPCAIKIDVEGSELEVLRGGDMVNP